MELRVWPSVKWAVWHPSGLLAKAWLQLLLKGKKHISLCWLLFLVQWSLALGSFPWLLKNIVSICNVKHFLVSAWLFRVTKLLYASYIQMPTCNTVLKAQMRHLLLFFTSHLQLGCRKQTLQWSLYPNTEGNRSCRTMHSLLVTTVSFQMRRIF